MKEKYRFFELITDTDEDFCRAPNKDFAEQVFERIYPNYQGIVFEVFMADWDPDKIKKNKK